MGSITRSFANLITANGPSAVADGSVTTADISGKINFKNIIINGDMSIAQRGTSESGIGVTGGTYLLDRFEFVNVGPLETWTMSQDTDVPTGRGFTNSMKFDCTTADASPAADDVLILRQIIEGQNLQYLKKGTANAESLTASFWVKSSKTGTYIAELYDTDNTRTISKSYTIDASDTWEKKTLTFAGDTTGAFNNDSNASLYLDFWLGSGSTYTSGTLQTSWGAYSATDRAVGQVNLADSTANEWFITGVQLEAGTTASDFEFLPYDISFDRCQRYYRRIQYRYAPTIRYTDGGGSGKAHNWIPLSPEMRTTPSFTVVSFTSTSGFTGDLVVVGVDQSSLVTKATNASGVNVCLYANGQATLDAEL